MNLIQSAGPDTLLKSAALALAALSGIGLSTAAAVFEVEETKIYASDGGYQNAFGRAVDLDGDTAIVGAWAHPGGGAAYVYELDPITVQWTERAKLTPSVLSGGVLFGFSVAVAGDTVVVGDFADGERGANAGAAYVHFRDSNTGEWMEGARLHAADTNAFDSFGFAVAADGDTLLISAPGASYGGAAYVFVRDPLTANWLQYAKLEPHDGQDNDGFGSSVALDGDIALIGARLEDPDYISGAGSAYVFVRDSVTGVWAEEAKLVASDAGYGDEFGWSVALEGGTAVVASRLDDDAGSNSGSAYVFARDPLTATWSEQAKLTASDAAENDIFGSAVAIDSGVVLVGAINDDLRGSAYVWTFDPLSSLWTEEFKLIPSDNPESPAFASSVALSGTTALIGAQGDDDRATNAGAAYIYELVTFNDPIALIGDLIEDVLNFPIGVADSLEPKLNVAKRALDDFNPNNDVAAINSLNAFINECYGLLGNQLTNEEADQLIAAAQQILALL